MALKVLEHKFTVYEEEWNEIEFSMGYSQMEKK